MTTANHAAMSPLSADDGVRDGRIRAARAGKWTYTPVSQDPAPEKGATLRHEELEVGLHYSSSIFEEFLVAVGRIQTEFHRRSQVNQEAAPLTAPAGERPGRTSRV